MDVKNEILNELKKVDSKRRIKIPKDIGFDYINDTLTLTLPKDGIGFCNSNSKGGRRYTNMQDDTAAFEGWAAVIKAYWRSEVLYNIILDVNEMMPSPQAVFLQDSSLYEALSKGHYGRFLYRAWKFSEEYDWFDLSPNVTAAVNEFKDFLKNNKCCNHIQSADAGINKNAEIIAEFSFCKHPCEIHKLTEGIKNTNGNVIRQLGCWLETESDGRQIFTAGKSAIDLWNLTDNELNVFELKAKGNCKVGIISELFFYAHYCNDMFSKDAIFQAIKPTDRQPCGRGYEFLVNDNIIQINGFMLADEYHPLVTQKVLATINGNHSGIKFYKLPEYDWEYIKGLVEV